MKQIKDIQYELYIQAAAMKLQKNINLPVICEALNALLDHGIYSETFLEFLHPSLNYNLCEWYQMFTKVLQIVHCAIPETEQEAKDSIVRYHLKQIVERKGDIFQEIFQLEQKLYNNNNDYSTMGAAEPLYETYYNTLNSYPFSIDHETEEDYAKLAAHLFKIALCCYKNS